MKCDKRDLLLYAVTDRSWSEGTTLGAQVEEALRGGATFVQLREKKLTGEALRAEALEIQAVCRRYGVPFVINDDVALAKEIDADGVHVGQPAMCVPFWALTKSSAYLRIMWKKRCAQNVMARIIWALALRLRPVPNQRRDTLMRRRYVPSARR